MNLKNNKHRVWEIDAARGIFVLGFLCFHLYYTVDAFCIDGLYNIDSYKFVNITDPLHFWFNWEEDGVIYRAFLPNGILDAWSRSGVNCFFIISGISYHFSRDNLRGGLRLLLGATFVGVFTKLLELYTGDDSQFIRFGALHCYTVCHMIFYFLLEKRSNRTLLLVAVVSLILGYYLHYNHVYSDFPWLLPFGIRENGIQHRDYWPVFPMLGWFLIGIVAGRKYYKEKVSLFPKLEEQKWYKPLSFLGRHSGLIYCGHMVVYSVLFIGIGHIFDLY